ncbi:MAG: SCO family protein [Rhodospirillales bacterium]|nr:SCO family protein [Alphaproteobacteria bacterium]MBL6948769.1 SCO family protein [Rhodospirillales bacterium]
MTRRIPTLLLAALLTLGAYPGAASETELDEKQAVTLSQAALGKSIGDARLTDASGRTVHLSDYRDKPLVMNFIYTSCAHSCGVMTLMLSDAYENARDVFGLNSFNAVTIGFDTANDTPERMRAYARKQGVEGTPGWRFMSTDSDTVNKLMAAAGFTYAPSPKGFDHMDQVTVIDAKGIINTQIYGATFEKPLLMEPLKEMLFGTPRPYRSLEDLIKKVRLFCTLYDPKTDRYLFDYSLFIQIAVGLMIIVAVIVFLARELIGGGQSHNRKERSV